MQSFKIAIIGLGYVGLPLALAFGKKFNTVGFDINKHRIKELQNKIDINLLAKRQSFYKSKKIKFSSNQQDLRNANIFIITVPTPLKKNKKPDLSYLYSASKIVANNLKKSDLVIYESTVYPGLTEEECVPVLEKYSDLKFNKDFFVGYSPERISPGDSKDLTNISKVVSGSNSKTTNEVYNLYKKIIKAKVYKATSIKVAEASKVIENAQRDINISFMNEISLIFSRLGINTSEVLKAANTKWNFLNFKPGLVGGHCISVDPYYLTYKAKKLKYLPKVILSGRSINDKMGYYVANILLKKLKKNNLKFSECKVGILGVTFKENCNDLRGSKVLDIIKVLKKAKVKLEVYDPLVSIKHFNKFYPSLKIKKIHKKLDALIVAVSHKEFMKLNYTKIKNILKNENSIIMDVKSIFNDKRIKNKFDYWSL
jgi:UDP-N-acetyl-D-glucosamine/UDP-N-acetyl-D-galactosamine dehydrogenase